MFDTEVRRNENLEAADQNPHYVGSVTETAEQQEVIAQEDIYAANGMKLLAKGARIDGDERRLIHVHPVTAYIVLQELKAGSPEMQQAVLQHHERLDGSGYPYGLSGAKICSLARIIAVAETLEAVTRRFDLARLDVILRLNHRRLDQAAEAALRDLLKGELHGADHDGEGGDITHRLLRHSAVMRNWRN